MGVGSQLKFWCTRGESPIFKFIAKNCWWLALGLFMVKESNKILF